MNTHTDISLSIPLHYLFDETLSFARNFHRVALREPIYIDIIALHTHGISNCSKREREREREREFASFVATAVIPDYYELCISAELS